LSMSSADFPSEPDCQLKPAARKAQAIISMVTTNPAGEVVAQLPLEKPGLLVLDIPRRL
jgi:hypothetical protein